MIQKIETIKDVELFFNHLIAEGLNSHPDTPFEGYVNGETHKPTYTAQEAALRDQLMANCFDICDKEAVDIYDLSMEIFLIATGMDKYIPLPRSLSNK